MGAPVLLVHSSGFTSRQWRKLGEVLAARGHRVLAPDLLGYATPWPMGEPFHFRQDVEMLAGVIGEEPAHVVGHSYGGFLALQLALAHPARVRSIAVYEPVAFGVLDEPADRELLKSVTDVSESSSPDRLEDWLATFVDWWNGKGAWAQLAPPTQQAFRDVGWKISQEVASLGADRTDRAGYARITAPTLLLAGDQTQPAERRVVEKLVAVLPNARLQTFPGLGHMGPIMAAATVNAPIVEHITRCE